MSNYNRVHVLFSVLLMLFYEYGIRGALNEKCNACGFTYFCFSTYAVIIQGVVSVFVCVFLF